MDQKTVRKLEKELNGAIADVICRLGLKKLPLLPSHRTTVLLLGMSVFLAIQLPSPDVTPNLMDAVFGCLGCWLWASYSSSTHAFTLRANAYPFSWGRGDFLYCRGKVQSRSCRLT